MALDLALLQQAANFIVGTHDFTSFAANDPDQSTRNDTSGSPRDNIRTIHYSTWRQEEELFIYRVTGSGFLHHMVRNLVGTFVEAATNRIEPSGISSILAARNRSAAGPTAPASGLFLVEVEY
jgi:tRNA pseudouridine38-40 synthase